MRNLRFILPVIISALFFAGCGTTAGLKKEKDQQRHEGEVLIHSLMEKPPVDELTASLSLNLKGTKVSGQLRMRYGRSIQISANMLGLVEIVRIEFLPEMVVIMDRVHNRYSVCHYADIPYRNELGLDFEVVQALLWNRIFSPGSSDETDAAARLEVMKPDDKGGVSVRDMECGYLFNTDGVKRVNAVSKSGSGYSFSIDYSDFTAVSDKMDYPLGLSTEINLEKSRIKASVKMSSVSTEKKSWPDRTQVSNRMKQVPLDELLENLDL